MGDLDLTSKKQDELKASGTERLERLLCLGRVLGECDISFERLKNRWEFHR